MALHIHILSFPKYSAIINEKRHDPMTHEVFKYGDEVVVCYRCNATYSLDVWKYNENTCNGCNCQNTKEDIIGSQEQDTSTYSLKKKKLTLYGKVIRLFKNTPLYIKYINPFQKNEFVQISWKVIKYITIFTYELIVKIIKKIQDR